MIGRLLATGTARNMEHDRGKPISISGGGGGGGRTFRELGHPETQCEDPNPHYSNRYHLFDSRQTDERHKGVVPFALLSFIVL